MKGWHKAFIIFHALEATLLGVLLWNYDFIRASSTVPGSVFSIIGNDVPTDRIDAAIANPDALQIAYNVGVLELLSIGLGRFS